MKNPLCDRYSRRRQGYVSKRKLLKGKQVDFEGDSLD
jgi:hypothetical protein